MTAATDSRVRFENYKHSLAGGVSPNVRTVRIASHPSFRDPQAGLRGHTTPLRNQGDVRRPPTSHSPRVRNRRRFAIAALILISVVAVLLPARQAFGGKSLVSSERPSAESSVVTIVVEPGDTLWSIARELEPNSDPRSVVDELVRARGTSEVFSGETIEWAK
jgi:hypothetical protein